jgi:23S rRNA (uridine2552-2'-O)-methyltransferase
MKKHPGGPGRGHTPVRVKKARGRTASSRQWLERQLNDPYVTAARAKGYRSRAAFKLIELDAKYRFLKKGARVLDLGAAPGGWSQVAAKAGATVVAADVLDMETLPGVSFLKADLTDPDVPAQLEAALGGPADLVLSDMAAPTTGHRATDHLRTIALVEIALDVA